MDCLFFPCEEDLTLNLHDITCIKHDDQLKFLKTNVRTIKVYGSSIFTNYECLTKTIDVQIN